MVHDPLERVRALIEFGRYPDACRLLAAYLAEFPDDGEALCLLAQSELGRGESWQATSAAQSAVHAQPDSEWPHRLAAIAAMRLGRFEAAVGHADEAIRLAPFTWQPREVRARVDIAAQHVDAATETHAREAVRLAPNSAGAHAVLGAVLFESKQHREAEQVLRGALRLDPQSVGAQNDLARVELARRRFGSAASRFASVAAMQPDTQVGAGNLVVAMRRMVYRIDLIIVATAWIVWQFGAGHGNDQGVPPISAVRIGTVLVLGVLGWYVQRMRRQLGPRAGSVVRQAARLSRQTAVWAGVLAVALLIFVVACVTPAPVNTRLVVGGGILLYVAVIMSWAARLSGRRRRGGARRSR